MRAGQLGRGAKRDAAFAEQVIKDAHLHSRSGRRIGQDRIQLMNGQLREQLLGRGLVANELHRLAQV